MWMKKLVEQALQPHEPGTGQVDPKPENNDEYMPTIYAIGCGEAGCKAIQRVAEKKIPGIITVAVDTNREHLLAIIADYKIPIGDPNIVGHGAGGFPHIGKKAAEESISEISARITSPDYVFIISRLGGGTGTGAAPVIAQIARDRGALVIVFCFWPFRVEMRRERIAEEGGKYLLSTADSVILLDINKLFRYVPGLPRDQAFTVMNELVAETIASLVELFRSPFLDGNPFPTLLGKRGLAVMLAGESYPQNFPESGVSECLAHPLFDIDYLKAKGCIVCITGWTDLTLRDADEIATSITYDLDSHAEVIWGARVREDYKEEVRIIALMTGLNVEGPLHLNSWWFP
jgi:cell division protein FtsZ